MFKIFVLNDIKITVYSVFQAVSVYQISSDQISRSVVSDSLRPHESQHARPPCPSPTLRVHWDSRPSSQWCHPAISSSVILLSSCPQSLPASESFPMIQLFTWGGQITYDKCPSTCISSRLLKFSHPSHPIFSFPSCVFCITDEPGWVSWIKN